MSFVDLSDEARAHKLGLLLWPRQWASYSSTIELTWQEFSFEDASIQSIPESQGVYAFCIKPETGSNLDTSYLIYVGETTRTLKQRFREYLRETHDPIGRGKVYYFFNMYRPYLKFCCAPLPESVSPKDIEDDLLKTYIPLCNPTLPAEVRKIASVVYV